MTRADRGVPAQSGPSEFDDAKRVWGAYVATCDAGDCDEDTTAVVLDEDDRWVAMCSRHAIGSLGGYTEADLDVWTGR